MNPSHNPELLDALAGAYALGSLRGGARRRFETLARERAPVRAAALLWQSRLSSLVELQPAVAPDPLVWQRIAKQLRAQSEAPSTSPNRATARPGLLGNLWLWRGTAAAAALAGVVAAVMGLSLREQLGAEVRALQARVQDMAVASSYVAVLADEQAAPAVLVTFDAPRAQLTLQRVGAYREAADRSLQLWALPPGQAPRSLGVLGDGPVLRLAASPAQLSGVPALAISLEPKGGAPGAGGPTGPVLFKGALLRSAL